MAVSDTRDTDVAAVIDGRKIADELVETVKLEAAKLKTATGTIPGIAVVIVGVTVLPGGTD